MHLRRHQASRKQHRPAVRLLHDVNPTVHSWW
jgi:hypothetical protein